MAYTLSPKVEALMVEAERRFALFGKNYGSDITKAYIGLGYPSDYRPATRMGLMECTHVERERTMGWYKFTTQGIALFRERARLRERASVTAEDLRECINP